MKVKNGKQIACITGLFAIPQEYLKRIITRAYKYKIKDFITEDTDVLFVSDQRWHSIKTKKASKKDTKDL